MLERSKTLPGIVALQAGWANRHWAIMIANILGDLNDQVAMRRLSLLFPAPDDAEATEQLDRLRIFVKVSIRTAAQRAWTLSTLSELPPDNWCGMLSTDADEANASLKKIYDDKCAITKAHEEFISKTHPEHMARA